MMSSLIEAPQICSSSTKRKTIRCDEHTNNVSKKLRAFYEQKEFFDIVLIAGVDKIKVPAHRLVLSASSEYFFAMFHSSMQEAKADEIELKELDGATMKLIIDFMYTASIELCCETVESVLRAADFLQISALITACCGFMGEHLDVSNCLGVALLAKQYNYSALEKKASRYASTHFNKVWTEKEFVQLNEEELIRFISSDDFIPSSEEMVFRSLVAWIEYDKENREKLILNLLSYIRFTRLDPKFIIENRHSVCKSSKCYQQICNWLKWHLSPESRLQFSTDHSQLRKGNPKLFYIIGSSTSDWKVQIFYPELNSWSFEELPTATKERQKYGATVINKKLIIAGGAIDGVLTNTVEYLDLQRKEWIDLPPMGKGLTSPAMAELNGDLYVVGIEKGKIGLCSVQRYDFVTGKWQDLAPLTMGKGRIRIVILDGLLYSIGDFGCCMGCYDPASDKWTRKFLRKGNQMRVSFAAVGDYIYAVGGFDCNNKIEKNTVERYHPSSNTWSSVSSLETSRRGIRCVAMNNRLIACGGFDGVKWVDLVEEYNPKTNKWTPLAPLLSDALSYYDNAFVI